MSLPNYYYCFYFYFFFFYYYYYYYYYYSITRTMEIMSSWGTRGMDLPMTQSSA